MAPEAPHQEIAVLPADVASKIAAGEVVERPGSVLRELVDNAIDAGAGAIHVDVASGGRALIRVSDDGCGIPREEMPRAFLRHATSKIRTADDLWAVRTLGFRGEALYSIAAVSKLTLLSRVPESAAGYEMAVVGGVVAEQSVRGSRAGTTVAVRDLFFNLPARLKFLKSAPSEAAHISGLVQQYALSHPHIRFTLTNEGRTTFHSPGDGDLRAACACVYGSDLGKVLLPVGVEPGDAAVTEWPAQVDSEPLVYGYVSPPAYSRSNRQGMHFFVNRRAVSSRMLMFAVQEAYHSLLMVGRFPICIVNVVLEPSLVDVNVHPAKAEVKFRDDRAVFSAVQRAVRSALGAHVPAPAYGSRGADGWAFVQPTWGEGERSLPIAPEDTAVAPPGDHRWTGSPSYTTEIEPIPTAQPRTLPQMRLVGQVGNTYILAEAEDGLFLVDQHAAHERVLYEDLSRSLEAGDLAIQPLLTPVTLECSASQWAEAAPLLPLLGEFGFLVEPFGESDLLVRGVPAIYSSRGQDLGNDLLEIIDGLARGVPAERWREEIAITLACHSAVRAGQALGLDEMRYLLSRLERCKRPRHCAHGRPTMLHLTTAQLEREFGRRS